MPPGLAHLILAHIEGTEAGFRKAACFQRIPAGGTYAVRLTVDGLTMA